MGKSVQTAGDIKATKADEQKEKRKKSSKHGPEDTNTCENSALNPTGNDGMAGIQNDEALQQQKETASKETKPAAESREMAQSQVPKRGTKRNSAVEKHRGPTISLPRDKGDTGDNTAPLKKEKKRKRKDVDNGDSSIPEMMADVNADERPKKKRKNRTGFADPRKDGSLGSQSQKALEYAFTQMNKPSKWKFNKARQNWIIRNVWSVEALPELYFPLVLEYLSKIQGGSQKKLRETAQSHLRPQVGTLSDPTKSSEKTAHFAEQTQMTITKAQLTPGPLILTGPDDVSVNEVDRPEVVKKVSEKVNVDSIRQLRAQMILNVFNNSNDNA